MLWMTLAKVCRQLGLSHRVNDLMHPWWLLHTGRLRLKMQKIHRVNLVRLNLLKSREIIERHWTSPGRDHTRSVRANVVKKKYGDAFENRFRTRLGVMMKIHSRFIARPLNRFTHVESLQPGLQVLSNGHESIQRTRSRDLLTLLSGCTVVSSNLCSSMLRLFGMHAPNMTPLPWSASSCLSIARAILHVRHRQTHVDVLATIGWPTLAWHHRHQKLFLLWDLLHGGVPPSLRSQVPSPVSSCCSYSFRNPLTLSLPSCRTSRRLKSFLPSSVALFNSLPISVVCCSSKRSFLQAVDKFFLFLTFCDRSQLFSHTFFP